ncbi:MAG: hypothetical protein JWO18_2291 [Microbacteriaceae bacterium]|nr:hypothetical protein [Microbacteriaceae bacterium]
MVDVRADASMMAARLHARLALDLSRSIDPFRVAEDEGIWVVASALDSGLAGYYLREGYAIGICVNNKEPFRRQRFTAAHELGHHYLGHGSVIDRSDRVTAEAATDIEIAADTFASAFLMPLGLMNRILTRLDLRNLPVLSASDVYRLSVEAGVSNAAAAWRLWELGRLSRGDALDFSKAGPRDAKRQLKGSALLGAARGDLRVFKDPSEQIDIILRVGDELVVDVRSSKDSGLNWVWDHHDQGTLRLGANAPVAADGRSRLWAVAFAPGVFGGAIVLTTSGGDTIERINVYAKVETDDTQRGLSPRQAEARVRSLMA